MTIGRATTLTFYTTLRNTSFLEIKNILQILSTGFLLKTNDGLFLHDILRKVILLINFILRTATYGFTEQLIELEISERNYTRVGDIYFQKKMYISSMYSMLLTYSKVQRSSRSIQKRKLDGECCDVPC